MWYNLNAAGKPDALTRHAVCPVVVGSRWGRLSTYNTQLQIKENYIKLVTAISKCIEDQQQLPKKLCLA